MGNTYGHKVILPLTNKSGGSVAAGDVVVIDTGNNEAFTTNTAGAFTGGVGIAQETIANNATGRVLVAGYAPLVNVNASVTRGNFGKTYTVAKQATDAGSSRVVGAFCQFLTGGTTPTAVMFGLSDASAASATVPTAHGCKVTRDTSDQSLGSNTFTAVQWNATDTFDTDSMHDPASNNSRITIPSISGVTTGLWRFNTHGYTSATSPRSDVKFRKNATTDSEIIVGPTTPSGVGAFQASWLAVLTAADYIEVFVRTTAGSFNLVATDATALPTCEAEFLGKVT